MRGCAWLGLEAIAPGRAEPNPEAHAGAGISRWKQDEIARSDHAIGGPWDCRGVQARAPRGRTARSTATAARWAIATRRDRTGWAGGMAGARRAQRSQQSCDPAGKAGFEPLVSDVSASRA